MRSFALVSLVLSVSLSACLPTSAFKPPEVTGKATGDLAKGSRVGARQDGVLKLAEVVGTEGDEYVVKFANRSTGKVKKADILPIAAPGTLKAGDRVLAPQQEMNLWQADVVRMDGDTAVVVFEGRSEEAKVPADRVAHLPQGFCDPKAGCRGSGTAQKDTNGGKGTGAPVEADPEKAFRNTLKIGDSVIVRGAEIGSSNHYEWRLASISGRNGDALVVKIPGEAEPKTAFASDIRPARAPKSPLAVGMTILWAEKPGRYLELWIGNPDADGKIESVIHRDPKARAGEGGDPIVLTKEQLSTIAPFAPKDY